MAAIAVLPPFYWPVDHGSNAGSPPAYDAAEFVAANSEVIAMPNVDESTEQRETYGGAPGWSQNQKLAAVPAANQDAQAESSPAPDAESASSAESQESSEEQVTQQAPAPTSQPEPEKKFNMPPQERWDAVIREREEARQRADRAEQLAQLALQKLQNPQAPVAQPEVDPYAGMDPQTAEFYRNLDKRIELKAAQLAEQKLQPLAQAYEAGRRKLAEIEITQFRKENPDIKPDSAEERAIASYVQSGMDLLSAKKLALFDKLEAENRALKGKQAAVPQKRAAAQSEVSSGIPAGAGLPAKAGDWRDRAGAIIDKGGTLKDVLGTVFGGSR